MISNLKMKAGARVSVHSEYNVPLMDEYGYNVMANTLTTMAVQEVAISRQVLMKFPTYWKTLFDSF